MHTLETFENGKWSPVLKSNQKDWLEGVKTKLEDSGYKCRIRDTTEIKTEVA